MSNIMMQRQQIMDQTPFKHMVSSHVESQPSSRTASTTSSDGLGLDSDTTASAGDEPEKLNIGTVIETNSSASESLLSQLSELFEENVTVKMWRVAIEALKDNVRVNDEALD